MKVFRRAKIVGRASATALVTVALVFAAASVAIGLSNTTHTVTSVAPFTITSTISSSSSSQIPALLYPGVQRYLWYTAHNSQLVPITVDSMGISGVNAPAACSITNLQFDLTAFTGSLVVPAQGTSVVEVPISMYDTMMNQDPCQGATFSFTYSGSAIYTEVYATPTAVTSSLNPSGIGQPVTYTATVSAVSVSGQDPVPSSPTGSVTFMDGESSIANCSSVNVVSISVTTSQATCTTYAYAGADTHSITAAYVNSDGNFSGSNSLVLSQVVS